MASFFSCFACDSKTSSVISPEKAPQEPPQQQASTGQLKSKEDNSFIEDEDRARTVTTLTFHNSELMDDEQETNNRVERLRKKSLAQRKAVEAEFIRKSLGTSTVMYLVENKWSEEYTQFLNNPARSSMRQINNRVLMDGKHLAPGLRERVDYYPVTQKVWLFLKKMYGGGPQLIRNNYLPSLEVPVSGLKNNHYFCYLNTGIQSLLSIGEFAYYFNNKSYTQIKHPTKSSKRLFSNCTTRAIKMFMDANVAERSLQEFAEMLEDRFSRSQQQDCHEFIRVYLEALQDELNSIAGSKKPNSFKNSQEAWNYYTANHGSIVDTLFAGQLTNLTKCGGCQNVSYAHDPFLELFIDIKGDTLEASLTKFFSIEKLADLYECDRCHSMNKAMRQLVISKTPAYLLITIKRFAKKKIVDILEYPFKLSLEKHTKYSPGKTTYFLHSVIVHRGSLEKGHYYSITRRGKKWYYTNDEKTAQLPLKDVLSQEAYILIYEREK